VRSDPTTCWYAPWCREVRGGGVSDFDAVRIGYVVRTEKVEMPLVVERQTYQ
jgi:hypothetical protein